MKKLALVALAAAFALPVVSVDAVAMDDAKMMKKMIKKGKKAAIKQCFACHDITENKQNKVGPPL